MREGVHSQWAPRHPLKAVVFVCFSFVRRFGCFCFVTLCFGVRGLGFRVVLRLLLCFFRVRGLGCTYCFVFVVALLFRVRGLGFSCVLRGFR